ncbi:MAG TPA: glutathione synthetase [Thermoanaerobaculia bacterium]|nr:glutathione synthetase [Thermoanaerobaculia bacterium]
MKIGFLVNRISDELPRYATTILGYEAHSRGHQVYYLTLEGFTYRPDGELAVLARSTKKKKLKGYRKFFEAMQADDAVTQTLPITELDVLMLRANPADEIEERPWAQHVGIVFGQEAARRGVLVLNDPWGLSQALDKTYFQLFPEGVRPQTLISRDPAEIKEFSRDRRTVLKPLQGSGGENVFMLREDEQANVNQIIEAVRSHGYVVAQEYLPAAEDGDVRLFVMNGRPLRIGDRIAAFRRRRAEGDMRSNMHVGGSAEAAELTDSQLEVAEQVRPRLLQDGMFLVGLDLAGDKLLEVNVFSPGGLYSVSSTQGAQFSTCVLDAIEAKIASSRLYPGSFSNAQLAVL